MGRRAIAVAAGLIGTLLWGSVAEAQQASGGATSPASPGATGAGVNQNRVSNEQVEAAIRRGVDFLLKSQKDGRWEKNYGKDSEYFGGETALVLYALLHAGKGSDDKRIQPQAPELRTAIHFLENLEPKSTYVTALQANALALTPKKVPASAAVMRARDLLLHSLTADGGYSYQVHADPKKKMDATPDLSNSQMAVLGMWSLGEAGVPAPASYWAEQEIFWRGMQREDGGWPYRRGNPSTYSMTAAGVATLYIVGDVTWLSTALDWKPNRALETGTAYLAKQWNVEQLDPYTLYSLERVGLSSGAKYLGKRNWYQEGAAFLLSKQKEDGSWDMPFHGVWDGRISTALSIIFLVRGRNPVIFNKLQYDGPWNVRPRDDARLTAYLSDKYEMPLNWQAVNMEVEAQEWMDAPVLLINGHLDPGFTPAQVAKLKEYVELGGLIFSTTNGKSPEFDEAIKRTMSQIVEGRHPVRELPADHAIFRIHNRIEKPPKVLGVSNGLRELWIHVPEDWSAIWQTKSVRLTTAWDVAANVFLYTRGKAPVRNRLQSLAVPAPAKEPTRKVAVGRLKYDGNWDPEPGAWARFSRLAAAEFNTTVELATVGVEELDPKKQRIVYVTGTEALKLTDAQVARLKAFVAGGGVLWADAAGSSPAFGESVVALTKKLLPNATLELLPADHTMYSPYITDGVGITAIKVRPYTAATSGRFELPKLMAAKSGQHFGVVFSPHDMLSGWLGTCTWGIDGYMPESSVDLGRNVLLYLAAEGQR